MGTRSVGAAGPRRALVLSPVVKPPTRPAWPAARHLLRLPIRGSGLRDGWPGSAGLRTLDRGLRGSEASGAGASCASKPAERE